MLPQPSALQSPMSGERATCRTRRGRHFHLVLKSYGLLVKSIIVDLKDASRTTV